MHTSRFYHALLTWLVMEWSRSYHILVRWLIMHRSRKWSCTVHVTDHVLITWLIMHRSRGWSCTDHVIDHALIIWLIMHWSRGWSYTDHVKWHSFVEPTSSRCWHPIPIIVSYPAVPLHRKSPLRLPHPSKRKWGKRKTMKCWTSIRVKRSWPFIRSSNRGFIPLPNATRTHLPYRRKELLQQETHWWVLRCCRWHQQNHPMADSRASGRTIQYETHSSPCIHLSP